MPSQHVFDNGGKINGRSHTRTVQLSYVVLVGAVFGTRTLIHTAVPDMFDNIMLHILIFRRCGGVDGQIPSEHGNLQ